MSGMSKRAIVPSRADRSPSVHLGSGHTWSPTRESDFDNGYPASFSDHEIAMPHPSGSTYYDRHGRLSGPLPGYNHQSHTSASADHSRVSGSVRNRFSRSVTASSHSDDHAAASEALELVALRAENEKLKQSLDRAKGRLESLS